PSARSSWRGIWSRAAVVLILCGASRGVASAQEDLEREVGRHLERAMAQPLGSQFRDVALAHLRDAQKALESGWSACALRDLFLTCDAMASFDATRLKPGTEDTFASFEEEWKQAKDPLFGQPKPIPASLPAERRALLETSRSEA